MTEACGRKGCSLHSGWKVKSKRKGLGVPMSPQGHTLNAMTDANTLASPPFWLYNQAVWQSTG
jgi:hypothetical protein